MIIKIAKIRFGIFHIGHATEYIMEQHNERIDGSHKPVKSEIKLKLVFKQQPIANVFLENVFTLS